MSHSNAERQNLVYVEFIESAPWNRAERSSTATLSRHERLIRAAIELSKSEDFKGRVGLHSLPQANKASMRTHAG
jgi:hypothetical protein